MRTLTIFLSCVLVAPSPAHAWNATGHKMTAEIAFRQLAAEQQRSVAAVLRAHPRFAEDFAAVMPEEIADGSAGEQDLWIFRRASIWPDVVPNQGETARNEYHRGTWHYINLPVYLTPEDEKDLAGTLDHNMSRAYEPPLRQGLNVVQALQGNLQVWRDAAATDAQRAVALCWILHLTGDLHQPLHTVALFSRAYFPLGDRGGNSIRIQQPPQPTNLHAVWDGLPNNFADQLPALLAIEPPANDDVPLDPAEWSRIHSELAIAYVYTERLKNQLTTRLAADGGAAMKLSAEYRSEAAARARQQVIAAGHRIAALLPQTF